MIPGMISRPSREQAEKLFGRKASPDANLTGREFAAKQGRGLKLGLSKIKNKVIDKVSDAMSYPARREAQKSILRSDRDLQFIKDARSKGLKTTREPMEAGLMNRGSRLVTSPQASPKAMQMRALGAPSSQPAAYAKAMERARLKGGSSGVGVGH